MDFFKRWMKIAGIMTLAGGAGLAIVGVVAVLIEQAASVWGEGGLVGAVLICFILFLSFIIASNPSK
jgi:hypothetical protein